MSDTKSRELRIVIPIEVTIRVGDATTGGISDGRGVSAAPAAAEPAGKTLSPAAEKLAIDQDYSNRDGYNPKFIPGLDLPLPKPKAKLAKQVAPLRPGEPKAEGGELKYTHFSIKLNKGKRIAIFTATNIDGKTYKNVDRTTGKVSDAAEG